MTILDVIRIWWTEGKIYLSRATSYALIINSIGMIFLVLERLKSYGIDLDMRIYAPLVAVLGLAGMLAIGYYDTKLGFYQYEAKRNSDRNPQVMEILENSRAIKKMLEKRDEDSIHKPDTVNSSSTG